MVSPSPERPSASAGVARPAAACFHCGEPCPDHSFALAGNVFCCLGCQTVFGLLRDNGLEQFYRLQSAPGTRMRHAAAAAKWAFLDDPVVAQELLDYADQKVARVVLYLPAIHCVACVWLLENLFQLHPGVGHTGVNFSRREAHVAFAPDRIKFSELAALLASIGYEPQFTLGGTEKQTPSAISKKTWLRLGIAAFGFGNIMLMALPLYLGLDSANGPWFKGLAGWLGLAMTLPVVTFSAADFWRTAWLSVRQRVLTLEVPIALGLAAIYAASVYEVLAHRGLGYCDSLCGLIFFLLLGRLFQKKTHDRLTFDRDYKGFFPLSVVRCAADGAPGSEESVAISRLKTGDHLILRNGELVPADARLVGGDACIDYSFVTGESEPVKCAPGARLYAGGRQVGGAIVVETVKPVAQSYLATLWNNEAFRKNRDRGLDSLTNRYSRRFTKIVIGVAAAAAVFWIFRDPAKSLKAFTSVLIVACPCALALAAPLTHGTAQRILARLKIFLKNALVLEHMAEVDTVVLDKTGTLTTAAAGGVAFQAAQGARRKAELSGDEAKWISSLARHSTHPNSVRVARALGGELLPVADFKETPGCGVEGGVAGRKILLGSRAWVCAAVRGDAGLAAPAGGSGVFVAVDGELLGAFSLENTLRPEVGKLIGRLGGRFELALLSGDNEREAARFRGVFGENAVLKFNQSPADKLNFIRDLQRRGRRVMMVGDGLNDAGALRQADVGVAVVEQTGVFSPASDVILDAAELPRLAEVLDFSRRAARVVRAGFVISALYNVAGVSIAAAGLLAPVVCAILMPVSTATVVVFSCGAAAWAARRSGLLTGRFT
ncbi:MAG: heavy metal translocating P-type ATPase metal-binding domain-containing protein [Verrucomicrobiota bacterium]